jgi:hypothetical protein
MWEVVRTSPVMSLAEAIGRNNPSSNSSANIKKHPSLHTHSGLPGDPAPPRVFVASVCLLCLQGAATGNEQRYDGDGYDEHRESWTASSKTFESCMLPLPTTDRTRLVRKARVTDPTTAGRE